MSSQRRHADRSRNLLSKRHSNQRRARRRFTLESLEGRRLLDASEVGGPIFDFDSETGVLSVTTTENDDRVTAAVVNTPPGPTDPVEGRTLEIQVETGGSTFSWNGPYRDVTAIRFDLDAGNDSLIVRDAVGQPITAVAGAGNDRISAGGGAASIAGGEGDDTITGSPEDDRIDAGAGNDTVSGLAGNDTIQGGWGDDELHGNEGNDVIIGDPGDWNRIDPIPTPYPDGKPTEVDGEVIEAMPAVILPHPGNDRISGDDGNDRLHGMIGDDVISGGEGFDGIHGGTGNDSIDGGDEPYIVYISPVLESELNNEVLPGPVGDRIAGGRGDDKIDAGRGDDRVDGDEGNDFIQGGWGNDYLAGGAGHDTIVGDPGDWDRLDPIPTPDPDETPIPVEGEVLPGDAAGNVPGDNAVAFDYRGHDTILGEAGNDRLHGMVGNDEISGGDDFDGIHGGTGNDSISGGDEPYIVYIRPGPVGDKISGGRGNDRIDAGNGDDAVSGDEGNDAIQGGWGSDWLSGGHGSDIIVGDPGDFSVDAIPIPRNSDHAVDAIVVREDAEIVRSRPHHDHIEGGDGPDRLHGMLGDDVIHGGGGDDGIHGGSGNDTITGGDEGIYAIAVFPPQYGGDKIAGGLGSDNIDAGTGDDYVSGGAGDDLIQGGWGNDQLAGDEGNDEIVGDPRDLVPTPVPAAYAIAADNIVRPPLSANDAANVRGADTITGDAGDDRIHGMYGSDQISGGRGHDGIDGGSGDDAITGDTGNDKLLGGIGNDRIDGGYGNDWVGGGAGDDLLQGGWGDDEIHGDDGNDSIVGDPGDVDEIDATPDPDSNRDDPTEGEVVRGDDLPRLSRLRGSDLIYGGAGNDRINGMFGNDRIRGGEGNDGIAGGSGSDRIAGGVGSDRIHGNRGRDRLLGGADDDRVVGGGGSDYIAGDEGADGLHALDGVVDAICRDNADAVSADPIDVLLCLPGPVMESVRVRSTTWKNNFENRPAANNAAVAIGGEIDIDGEGKTTIPWANIDQIVIAFDQDVSVDADSLILRGNDGRYSIAAFSYYAETFTGTWTLDEAIDGDAIALGVVDRNGAKIGNGLDVPPDLSTVASDPSFSTTYSFNVAAGDVNGDGVVDVRDVRQAAAGGVFSSVGDETYIAEHDFDGDGSITLLDVLGIRNAQGTRLAPTTTGSGAPAAAGAVVAAAPEARAADRVLAAVGSAHADRRQDVRRTTLESRTRSVAEVAVDTVLGASAAADDSSFTRRIRRTI
jgi:Ca2+-binding RTX toxin-like protein